MLHSVSCAYSRSHSGVPGVGVGGVQVAWKSYWQLQEKNYMEHVAVGVDELSAEG